MTPDAAVQAAAKGLAANAWGDWEYVPDELRRLFLRDAKVALEAAAPHIAAQALEDAADIAGRPENRWWAEGQNRAKWLRNLAAAERGSK